MRRITLEAAWTADADLRAAEAMALLPGAEASSGVVMVPDGLGASMEIAVCVVTALVLPDVADAAYASVCDYMMTHSSQASYLCARSAHVLD